MGKYLPETPLRIMTGYLPRWRAAACPELASPLDRETQSRAIAFARQKGLKLIA
jgi:uncharacterized Fe-S radical SAM superfamily protein PflX